MTNQNYLQILELLKKDDLGNKWVKFTLYAIACTSGIALYYHYRYKKMEKQNEQVQADYEGLRKNFSGIKDQLQYSNAALSSYKEENLRLLNENNILSYKLKTFEKNQVLKDKVQQLK
jgi:hypothetical protein